ncbi:glycosyl transferase [Aliidongia dinghuensis]|uniref:Glycosyl transferase n=1 Tax=Aliidongia dinghuensis TaxID=1867774 RepID=A0A8J2YVH1_9PROT|nr:glycosyl transferase [Aliidongia dinghuensis]
MTAVILDYNKARRVVENVRGLLRQRGRFKLEIIVADNSCNPANAAILAPLAEHDGVKLLVNSENLHYVRGCNRAAEQAIGAYILIVNPDILWPELDTVQVLLEYLQKHPSVGIVGPKQIEEPSGKVAMTARAFPRLFTQVARRTPLRKLPGVRKLVAYDEMAHLDVNRTQPVDWLQSSCFLVRRDLWDEVGGFDPRYVMFLADPEICWQSWSRGLSVVYHADAVVAADGIRCSSGGLSEFFRKPILRQHLRDSLKYRWRHAWRKSPRRQVV